MRARMQCKRWNAQSIAKVIEVKRKRTAYSFIRSVILPSREWVGENSSKKTKIENTIMSNDDSTLLMKIEKNYCSQNMWTETIANYWKFSQQSVFFFTREFFEPESNISTNLPIDHRTETGKTVEFKWSVVVKFYEPSSCVIYFQLRIEQFAT